MKLLIQKFGGTSVATQESRKYVFEKIKAAKHAGYEVVVVISAMGRRGDPYATDTLLDFFSKGKELPNSREQDMIYACGEIISGAVIANELCEYGIPCVFLTGGQAGIITNNNYSDAPIITIQPSAIQKRLEQGYVVLVAGGQGISEEGDYTSLGRGGSDTTACAIGYYMGADEVRIYTDVDGVYTGDPRIIKNAVPIPYISYEQCKRLAEYGAKVIHPKAVAFSQRGGRNVLSVRSTFTDNPGTCIGNYTADCIGITALRAQSRFKLPKALEKAPVLPKQPLLICEDDNSSYFCVDHAYRSLLPNTASDPFDVIFAVGPGVHDRLNQFNTGNEGIESIWKTVDDTAVIFVNPDHFNSVINRLHDYLCIKGGVQNV